MFTIEVKYKTKGMRKAAIRDRYMAGTVEGDLRWITDVEGFTVANVYDNATGARVGRITKSKGLTTFPI